MYINILMYVYGYNFLPRLFMCVKAGVREETVESDERDQGSETRSQHFRRRERRSSHQSR